MLDKIQNQLCDDCDTDFGDLSDLFVNCTLKNSPRASHTDTLMDMSREIMRKNAIAIDSIRIADHEIAYGVYPGMTEHGAKRDEWPDLWPRVKAADIVVIGTPIWLGEKSSACQLFIEKLYAHSGQQNEKGQAVFYGKVGGALITGNEDGVKHCGMGILYSLQHVGFTVPP